MFSRRGNKKIIVELTKNLLDGTDTKIALELRFSQMHLQESRSLQFVQVLDCHQ